jgi:hypothetical protein
MSESNDRVSNDLIRWLKMLALPKWAKLLLALIMLTTLASGLILLADGMIRREKDIIAVAVSILTIAMPIGLIVIALVFGDGGGRKLRELTKRVLEQEIPEAIRENLIHGKLTDSLLTYVTRGFIADYVITAKKENTHIKEIKFSVELNVKKVNVVFHVDCSAADSNARAIMESRPDYQACLIGAEGEGYVLNSVIHRRIEPKIAELVFIKRLHDDFLLEPAHRLYFAQDLAFFVRGMLEATLNDA